MAIRKTIAKAVTRVHVEARPANAGYVVVLTNTENQTIRPYTNNSLRAALTEASEWADFHGIQMTPYRVMGKIVEPVTKDTYKQTTLKTFEQVHAEYRTKGGELNWNKVMHWEWQRFRGVYRDKEEMKTWLMPHFMEGPPVPEWLATNCKGSWMPAKGGFRFSDDRDASLYKLFFAGNRDDGE
jgi:hypothetical protein